MLYRDFLKLTHSCPFCADDQRKLSQTEHASLTYALAPYHPHHMLVVPKRHVLHFLDLTPQECIEIDTLVRSAFEALAHLGYENITALVREGEGSGKSVPHAHYHVIPNIRIGDIDHQGNERSVLSKEEIDSTFAELANALKK